MKSIRSFAIQFYLPLLVSTFLFLIIVVSPKFISLTPPTEINAEVSVVGIKMPLSLWVQRVWILRVILIVGALISLLRALNVDFSKYFQTRFVMDVYFDERGIERNLKQFSIRELDDVSLAVNWKQSVASYYENGKISLGKLWATKNSNETPEIGDFERDLVHACGATSFIVKRVGLLSYRITESSGRLNYDWDVPQKPRRSFRTEFELRETAANHVRPNLWALIKYPAIILKPEFKQVFSIEGCGEHAPFDHIVIGLTKVILLPFPRFTDTIYLWKLPSGATVPVAYGVYISQSETEQYN